jgi:hypothetical protein
MEKIPCIKYNSQDWDYIESNLIKFGYEISRLTSWEASPYIVLNLGNNLGRVSNIDKIAVLNDSYNREIVYNVEEFLERAAHLKGRDYIKRNVMKIHDIEIKPGMGIFIYDRLAENLHVVIPIKRGLGVIAYGVSFTWYTLDDFLERYSSSIVAICDIPNSVIEGDILWEKPQEIVITMQDIAEKFNCPVESIKIKK